MARKKKEEPGNGTTAALRKKRIKLQQDGTGKGLADAGDVIVAAQAATSEPTTTPATPPAPQKAPLEVAKEKVEKALERARGIKTIAELLGLMGELTAAAKSVKEVWQGLQTVIAEKSISNAEIPNAILAVKEEVIALNRVVSEVQAASHCQGCGTPLPEEYLEERYTYCKTCNDAIRAKLEAEQRAHAARIKSMKDRLRAAVRKS